MKKGPKAYSVIWERIRANPDKGVPIDIVDPFVSRVIKAVKNEKYYDEVYRLMKMQEKKTGLMFVTRAAHPDNSTLVRVTFLLREFDTFSLSDSFYLRKYPPDTNLVKLLGFETLPAISFGVETKEYRNVV